MQRRRRHRRRRRDGPRVSGLNGDIEAEGKGRQKLVVTIPSRGGVAVIDAQELLDSKAGAYEPCHVERWLPLSTAVPDLPPKPPTGGVACVDPKSEAPELPAVSEARPTTLAYADGRLYASDLDTSLIHVIDLPTPCEPVEVRPSLPTSLQEPKRAVTTSHVAVAPTPTPDLKRYLYAIDARDGSAMVFDVSDDQASQFPLQRPQPEWNPLAPSDRIFLGAPAADILIATRDIPESNPATGTAPEGLRCDPDPTLTVCQPTSQSCDLATAYRTDVSTYTSGAGPAKLRGTFAFLALTSGRVAVIDIDDFDAPCRGPVANSPLFGCPPARRGAPTRRTSSPRTSSPATSSSRTRRGWRTTTRPSRPPARTRSGSRASRRSSTPRAPRSKTPIPPRPSSSPPCPRPRSWRRCRKPTTTRSSRSPSAARPSAST